jgi:4-aminobutyrate aminotransferase/(S)-3-amino-2-methylpropionate transaminase
MAGNVFSHTPMDVETVQTAHRRIKTQLPVPQSLVLFERLRELETRAMHGQIPIVWDRAEGCQVYDKWGNIWLDFTSTIFVANAGHANNRIIRGLQKLLKKPLLHTYTYLSGERLDYLEYLIRNTPPQFEKAFLLSAGTEATEVALKLMRMKGQENNKNKVGVVCFAGAYHGRTMGAQFMNGPSTGRNWIGYNDPNIYHIEFPYPWAVDDPEEFFEERLDALLKDQGLDPNTHLAGFMLETYQGWGAIFYPKRFVQALMVFARKNNMLIAFDEMQSGFGRTGKLFGYQHYGIEPDILCCGKGASSGPPLALVLGSSEIMDLPEIGSMSSTHSANPIACVAGLENMKALIEDGLIDNAAILGNLFHQKLNALIDKYPKRLRYVFGEGLVAALIFMDEENNPLPMLCDRISELAFQRGLLVVHTGRESIKLAPPLSISKDALLEGIEVLDTCIRDTV